MTKDMTNASFYRLKFRTIDWFTKKIVGGQPLIWWLELIWTSRTQDMS